MTKRSFFAVSFFGIALLFGALAVWQRERQLWVPVQGEVVQVSSRRLVMPPQEGKFGTYPPQTVDVPWVSYSYVVDGRTYPGKAAITGRGGAGFTVYYDPEHPERSRLDQPEARSIAVVLGLAAVFFVAGLRVWLGGPAGRKIAEPA